LRIGSPAENLSGTPRRRLQTRQRSLRHVDAKRISSSGFREIAS
jgi:hypothetical protein